MFLAAGSEWAMLQAMRYVCLAALSVVRTVSFAQTDASAKGNPNSLGLYPRVALFAAIDTSDVPPAVIALPFKPSVPP